IHAPARRVARPRVLTLVLGNTHHRVPARAHPALAGVGLRAHVAVVTLRRCRHLDTPRFGAECLAEISTAVAWPTALPAVARVAVDVTIAVVFAGPGLSAPALATDLVLGASGRLCRRVAFLAGVDDAVPTGRLKAVAKAGNTD